MVRDPDVDVRVGGTGGGAPRWEYRVARVNPQDQIYWVDGQTENLPFLQALQEWGDAGWELVAAQPLQGNHGEYVFKRPLGQ